MLLHQRIVIFNNMFNAILKVLKTHILFTSLIDDQKNNKA